MLPKSPPRRPGTIALRWIILPWIALLWIAVLGQGGCLDADTLGGEQVDEVIISGTPTWNNGIGELMRLKCGTCHQVPAGALSPATVPADLHLNAHTSPSPGIRGAQDIAAFIDAGILTGSAAGTRQMPLAYATPLTDQEISALEAWAAGGGL